MRKEYDFSKAELVVPPRDRRKTRITIRIDTKILNWFRKRVHEAGGGNYQNMINEALKSYIESDNSMTLRYPGATNLEFDEKLRTIMEADGYELSAGGYNRKDNIRDLEFIKEKAA